MSELNTLLKDIHDNLSQKSASQKDEVKVMQVMLNDKEYAPSVYNADGSVAGTYCPAEDARQMISSVLTATAKISKDEATTLADAHVFTKGEATSMVGISKEYVNAYMQTGRKLPFGNREDCSISLIGEQLGETTKRYPKKVGIDGDGKAIYENTEKVVPPHLHVKAAGSCPAWKK